MKRNQSGMTLLGFLLVLVVVGFAAFIAMRLFPMYQEFYAVKSSLKGVAAEPGVSDMDPAKIQDLFFRRLYINYSESVKPSHVKIERMDGGWHPKRLNIQRIKFCWPNIVRPLRALEFA